MSRAATGSERLRLERSLEYFDKQLASVKAEIGECQSGEYYTPCINACT